MLYYTQLIFIKEGQEDQFNLFESHVLPLLEKHNGTLLYRVRPTDESVIEALWASPMNCTWSAFHQPEDFVAYGKDRNVSGICI